MSENNNKIESMRIKSVYGILLHMRTDLTICMSFVMSKIAYLKRGVCISRSLPFQGLDVFPDDNGILRVGGHLTPLTCQTMLKNQLLFSSRSPLARSYTFFKHQEFAPQGRTTSMNAIQASAVFIYGGA